VYNLYGDVQIEERAMKKMQAYELRRDMKAALDDIVRDGDTIVITRNGAPIAELIPYGSRGVRRQEKTGAQMLEEFRKAGPLSSITDREIAAMRDRSRERRRD
jgi:prevent-host-death family protein